MKRSIPFLVPLLVLMTMLLGPGAPGAGGAGLSVRTGMRVFASVDGRPDRVPGPTGSVASPRSTSPAAETEPAYAPRTLPTPCRASARRGSGMSSLGWANVCTSASSTRSVRTGSWRSSSRAARYTLPADFWNTWQQDRLDQLVADGLVAKSYW